MPDLLLNFRLFCYQPIQGETWISSTGEAAAERGKAIPTAPGKGDKAAARHGLLPLRTAHVPIIRGLCAYRSHLRKQLLGGLFPFILSGHFAASGAYAGQTYQSGGWTTECKGGRDARTCSLVVPFSRTENGQRVDYALAVLLSTGDIAIVGKPPPVRAVLRIGNNPPMECRESQPCLFPRDRSIDAILQLSTAPVILIDVLNSKSSFKFSLTTHGYQAGLAQIRAWGYFAN